MTPRAILAELRRRHVQLIPEGTALRYRAPKGALTPELRNAMTAHKAALLALVSEATGKPSAFDLGGEGERLTLTDCCASLAELHGTLAHGYRPEAAPWRCGLAAELAAAEGVIDRLAATENGPPRADWSAALAGYAAVWREAAARFLAKQERQTEPADWGRWR